MTSKPEELRWIKSSRLAVVSSEEDSRFAILNLDASQPVVLTGSGAAIWSALDQYDSVPSMALKLSVDYDIEIEILIPQIRNFLEQLAAQRLIVTPK
ncbi:PqqD family protein [Paeniglutamicibacter sp. Y32M11]|uniref:PqqD family protein n=1 Tax=Paeniglutamicibacter sp. Y32M11 TaxID=2853258 RepID=UPI001C52A588|nr:PqqD family protein [Paeniglutamicibacter sp. Y32M11]QXQ09652.1 PqqD family protein [Paeniglutamicibacter sp. Y32M11]